MIVVSPYRPFPAESREHQALGSFDWVDALRMLAASVELSCGCATHALTDEDTDLGVPAFAFATHERRLMLWILEVSLRYLESARFTEDTVFVSPDTLVFGDLAPYFAGDLTVVVRPEPKYEARPIINSVQWWPKAAQARLVRFYTQALAIAQTLPESMLAWGADSEPLRQLLSPLVVGRSHRAGLDARLVPMNEVMISLPRATMDVLDAGLAPAPPTVPILDFRFTRKRYLRRYFDAVIGVPA